MTKEQQRIAIAEVCGWKRDVWNAADGPRPRWFRATPEDCCYAYEPGWDGLCRELPDYVNSLDAMHSAEKTLTREQQDKYAHELGRGANGGFLHVTASAELRARTFLRTLNLWQESEPEMI